MELEKFESTPSENKLLFLEIIRFFSAFAVLIWHYQHFSYQGDSSHSFYRELQPFYTWLKLFYDYGLHGVEVFWCISGFIFFRKYRFAIAEGKVSKATFFKLRFSRLYPLHLVTFVIAGILQFFYYSYHKKYFVYQFNDVKHFLLQIFLASNWGLEEGYSFNGPIWSISIEVLVYAAFYLLLKRFGKAIGINLAVVIMCIFTIFIYKPFLFFVCMTFFYMGGLAEIIPKETNQFLSRQKYNLFLLGTLLLFPVISAFFNLFQNKYYIYILLLIYTPALLHFTSIDIKVPSSVSNIIQIAGNMTYSSYLLHFPIQLSIALYYSSLNKNIPYTNKFFFFSFFTSTFLLSIFTYYGFERPVQNFLRKKWIYK